MTVLDLDSARRYQAASRRDLRDSEVRLNVLLDEVLNDLRSGRADVAITNLCHAVQLAKDFDVHPSTRLRLTQVVVRGGGFR